jgi:hypothetical protein
MYPYRPFKDPGLDFLHDALEAVMTLCFGAGVVVFGTLVYLKNKYHAYKNR